VCVWFEMVPTANWKSWFVLLSTSIWVVATAMPLQPVNMTGGAWCGCCRYKRVRQLLLDMGLELPESPKPQPNISLLSEGSAISGLDLDPGMDGAVEQSRGSQQNLWRTARQARNILWIWCGVVANVGVTGVHMQRSCGVFLRRCWRMTQADC